jgi:hypothetical protein
MLMTSNAPLQGGHSRRRGSEMVPIPASQVGYLIRTAGRAPSVHNTQPWRFKISENTIELYADPRRKLRIDPLGREMLISCGAALFGLRLAARSLGYQPNVDLLPEPGRLRLLARMRLCAGAAPTPAELRMVDAIPHRHTHRGPFADEPLPDGLLAALQHDALAEGATLTFIQPTIIYSELRDIVSTASRRQDLDPVAREEIRRWTRATDSRARDGVPAQAFTAAPVVGDRQNGRLRQRDFDLGRELGLLANGGPQPASTAVLISQADRRVDWLRAGQALHRLLLHAADRWVSASLYTQPLEAAAIRSLIRTRLGLPGPPQMLLQFGRTRTMLATARRDLGELMEP